IHVRASDLEPAGESPQAALFDADPRRTGMEALDASVDDLRRRYGNRSVVWGARLADEGAAALDPKADNTVHPVSFFHA
ncbi:MAG: DNA polymerase IV, partial [Eggerthella lenta]